MGGKGSLLLPLLLWALSSQDTPFLLKPWEPRWPPHVLGATAAGCAVAKAEDSPAVTGGAWEEKARFKTLQPDFQREEKGRKWRPCIIPPATANRLANFLVVCFYRFYTANVMLYIQLCIHFLKHFQCLFVTKLSEISWLAHSWNPSLDGMSFRKTSPNTLTWGNGLSCGLPQSWLLLPENLPTVWEFPCYVRAMKARNMSVLIIYASHSSWYILGI